MPMDVLAGLPTEVPDQLFPVVARLLSHIQPVVAAMKDYARKAAPDEWEWRYDAWLDDNQNVHSRRLPLMDPFEVLLFMLGYLGVLVCLRLAIKIGLAPSLKDTSIMWLFQLCHNVLLTALSLYMFLEITRQAVLNKYTLWFNNLDDSAAGWPMAKILWIFYVSKIYEFLDTVIMLLRRSLRQVTFLHVYHHCSIFPIWWLVIFMGPTGDSYFSAAFNSFVHVVMYSYYLLATFNIDVPWKRYITLFQMLQFAVNFCQAACLWYVEMPGYPRLLAQVLFIYMISLLILFYNFYTNLPKKREGTRRTKAE